MSAGFVNFVTTKFYANAHCYVILPKSEIVENRYIYHFLKLNQSKLTEKQHGAGIPALKTNEITKLSIPIPPLPIQQEIVNILDKFTELEAELEARKKQYEYYRAKLLAFSDLRGVKWLTLNEICYYSNTRIDAVKLNEENYIGVDNLLQDKQGKTNSSYVPEKGNLCEFLKDDILIGNIRPYLKKIWKADKTGGTNGDVLVIRINEDYKDNLKADFLYYLLSSDDFFNYDAQYSKGTKMPRGDKTAVMKFKIPIPHLEEQARIVAILDKFDKLVNDISEGLPAELNMRRQQYEYYRNKLLTFENVA